MKTPLRRKNWFFVDESGDPTFYDRKGNLIVGQEGCSPILLLGFIETVDPAPIRQALLELQIVVADKVSLLVDIYDVEKYPNNWYNRKSPFHVNKITPLSLGPVSGRTA